MSGSNAGKPPDNVGQVIRDMQRDIRALQQKTTSRAGKWVLSSNAAGALIATGPGGQVIELSQPTTIVQQPVLDILEDDDTGGA